MKVALVHSFYSPDKPSGENQAVLAQRDALLAAGVEVKLFSQVSPSGNVKLAKKFELGLNVALDNGFSPLDDLRKFEPDLVHVHNLFPNFSTTWLGSVESPVISTLHNFRHTCANGVFFRNGQNCFDCLQKKSSLPSLVHGCYRDSRISTVPLAWRIREGAAHDPLILKASKFVVLSDRAKTLHIESGIPEEKMCLIPNFVRKSSIETSGSSPDSKNWAFVGRLTTEKGILELCKNWPDGEDRLIVYGEGPLFNEIQNLNKGNVELRGALPNSEVAAALIKCVGLFFPSVCSESAVPLAYLEAIALGLPVIAKSGNGAADDVIKAKNGIVLDSWQHLTEAMANVRKNWNQYKESSQSRFSENYTESVWSGKMLNLYNSVIEEG